MSADDGSWRAQTAPNHSARDDRRDKGRKGRKASDIEGKGWRNDEGEGKGSAVDGKGRKGKGDRRGRSAADTSDNWRSAKDDDTTDRFDTRDEKRDDTWDTGQKGKKDKGNRERENHDRGLSSRGKKGKPAPAVEGEEGEREAESFVPGNESNGKGTQRDKRKGKKGFSNTETSTSEGQVPREGGKGKRYKQYKEDNGEGGKGRSDKQHKEDDAEGMKGKRDKQRKEYDAEGRKGKRDKQYKEDDTEGRKGKRDKQYKEDNADRRKRKGKGGKRKGEESDSVESEVEGDRPLLSRRLSADMRKGKYECMICFSGIRTRGVHGSIWSCRSCWASFHVNCIHSWIKKSNENCVRASSAMAQQYHWPCPGCRHIHVEDALPEYTCFCGKERDPLPSPHYAAHSCGQVCGQVRPNCPHPCTALCHAGPCNPCSAYGGGGQCYCGGEVKSQTRCGEAKVWSCGEQCGAPLSCKTHSCPLKCHAGICAPCGVINSKTCHCEKVVRELPCGEVSFSCNELCGRSLSCEAHTCQRTCHVGACGECPWAPALWGQRCACGATQSSKVRESCFDPLEVCVNLCGKAQSCSHKCTRTCHEDACGNCEVPLKQDCRCRNSRRTESCHIVGAGPYLCDTVCKQKKSCNRHRCTNLCCEARSAGKQHEMHLCLQVCGRPLPCGEHTCEDFCHLGNCPPCRVIRRYPLSCGCGAQVIEPPVPCGTRAPFCMTVCGKEMSCGHRCPSLCHVDEHPPCTHLVTRSCAGGHTEINNIPCHVETMSCSKPCDRALPCGHRCAATCHSADIACPPCAASCGAARVHCEHQCDEPCHPGTACGETPCTAKVHVTCLCGKQVTMKPCGACAATGSRSTANLKCLPTTCGTGVKSGPSAGMGGASPSSEGTRYAQPLVVEWRQHRKYLFTVEGTLQEIMAAKKSRALPACVSVRKNLVCALAWSYYGLEATVAHHADDYWVVTISPSAKMRCPNPRLSSVLDDDERVLLFPPSSPAIIFKDFPPKLESRVQQWIYANIQADEPIHLVLSLNTYTAYFRKAASANQAFQRITGQGAKVENVSPARGNVTQWIEKLHLSLINVPFLGLRSKVTQVEEKKYVEDAW